GGVMNGWMSSPDTVCRPGPLIELTRLRRTKRCKNVACCLRWMTMENCCRRLAYVYKLMESHRGRVRDLLDWVSIMISSDRYEAWTANSSAVATYKCLTR